VDTVVTIVNHTDTVYVIDTVVTVQHHYDTTEIVDTVLVTQCAPNEFLAMTALHYYTDPLVLEFIYQEFGLNEGWMFYLSTFQSEITVRSASVYDIYGLIDYWAPDWSGYYPLEYYWRMTYIGGDPADPDNWQIGEPPAAVSGHRPGICVSEDTARARAALR